VSRIRGLCDGDSKEVRMSCSLGPGFHAPAGKPVDSSAYERWTGRWSRMFVPMVIAAAQVASGDLVLDVSTGTGEAALVALQAIGASGLVIGVDIAPAMLTGARERLNDPSFWPVAADGQALPFKDASFDAVVCQLGLQFFPDPARGLTEFRRVLRSGASMGVCVISTPDKAPMWGILAEELGRRLPAQRPVLNLSFALADESRLHALFANAGFRDIAIERVERHDAVESFDAYWEPIEGGTGSIPQIYLTLSEAERRAVREEVKQRLSRFEVDGKLVLGVEMLIARGQA
jgi:SAM-dependent methyltransferase